MKVVAALVYLVAVATLPPGALWAAALFGAVVLAGVLAGRLPAGGVLLRAAVVLPFSGMFAAISVVAGDPARAAAVLVKSYLSALSVLLVVGTTPMPRLLHGVEKLGAPRMVVLVIQFLYRYLFVISEQGQHMRLAARCRGELGRKRHGHRASRFRAAAGALAVLFGRAYQRAEAIHRAMLARGFDGHFRPLRTSRPGAADVAFLLLAITLCVSIRLLPEVWPG